MDEGAGPGGNSKMPNVWNRWCGSLPTCARDRSLLSHSALQVLGFAAAPVKIQESPSLQIPWVSSLCYSRRHLVPFWPLSIILESLAMGLPVSSLEQLKKLKLETTLVWVTQLWGWVNYMSICQVPIPLGGSHPRLLWWNHKLCSLLACYKFFICLLASFHKIVNISPVSSLLCQNPKTNCI